jgi:hypothetical protein
MWMVRSKVGGECGMVTFECCEPHSGGENWQEEGTLSYKKVNKVSCQDADIFSCVNIPSFRLIISPIKMYLLTFVGLIILVWYQSKIKMDHYHYNASLTCQFTYSYLFCHNSMLIWLAYVCQLFFGTMRITLGVTYECIWYHTILFCSLYRYIDRVCQTVKK